LEFQRQLIADLPIQTQNYSYNAPSDFNQLVGIATQLGTLLQNPTVKEIFESLFPPN
jgi:hypothetical protein